MLCSEDRGGFTLATTIQGNEEPVPAVGGGSRKPTL